MYKISYLNLVIFQKMGISESRPAAQPEAAAGAPQQPTTDDKFKEEVRKAANDFKNLVQLNKVMIFSATYCSYCTVAKVRENLFRNNHLQLLLFRKH